MHTVRVWDLPTRLFHWALVGCVVGLVITGNSFSGDKPAIHIQPSCAAATVRDNRAHASE